jgi:tetratricopeptide (TPR) repeat protein
MVVGLAAASLAAVPTTRDSVLDRYQKALEAYRAGRFRDAVSTLAAFDSDQLQIVGTYWAKRALGASGQDAGTSNTRLREFEAAAMFHTDCAFALGQAARPLGLPDHLAIARQLVDQTRRFGPETQSFRRRWYLAVLMYLHAGGLPDDSADVREAALAAFPRDGPLLLEIGAREEVLSYAYASTTTLNSETGLDEARSERIRRLRVAQEYLERALSADASLIEARLRLGRIQAALGHDEAARAAYESVLNADAPAEVAHVANLFLGEQFERAGQLDPAIDRYRQAVASHPDAQTAHTALAHALYRDGRLQEALDESQRALATAGHGDDPWRRYVRTQLRSFDDLLTRLREDARR